MKAKTIKTGLIFMLLAGFIFFISCQKEETMAPAPVNKEMAANQEILIPDAAALQLPVMTDATIDNEFSLSFSGPSNSNLPVIILDENTLQFLTRQREWMDFVRFLNSLNLSREQAYKMLRVFNAYLDCRNYLLREINREINEILKKGNLERQRLLALYRNGQITRQQFDRLMNALNLKIRKEVNESPAIARLKLALEKCHLEFMENVRLILDRNQWEKWFCYFKMKNNPR